MKSRLATPEPGRAFPGMTPGKPAPSRATKKKPWGSRPDSTSAWKTSSSSLRPAPAQNAYRFAGHGRGRAKKAPSDQRNGNIRHFERSITTLRYSRLSGGRPWPPPDKLYRTSLANSARGPAYPQNSSSLYSSIRVYSKAFTTRTPSGVMYSRLGWAS